MKRSIRFILFVALFFSFIHHAKSQQRKSPPKNNQNKNVETKNLTAEQIAEKYLPSVVLIVCDDGKGNFSQGSGFFIRQEMILTNYHVIKDMVRGKAKTVSSNDREKEWWIEKILYTDEKNDLALLSINEPDKTKTPFLNLSASNNIKIGETIYVLSNPKGLTGTISQGIVSSGIRETEDTKLLQIDAPISSGSSGGAVLNARGEVVGIATASLSSGQNLNFAVPSSDISDFLFRYDANSAFNNKYTFVRPSEIQNAWTEGKVLGSEKGLTKKPERGTQIPPQKELSIEQREQRLNANLQNVYVSNSNIKVQIKKFMLSRCKANISMNLTDGKDGNFWEQSYTFDLNNIKNVDFGKNGFGIDVVFIEFFNKIPEIFTYDSGSVSASLENSLAISVENEGKQLLVWLDFSVLKNICSEDKSYESGKPTLKETTDWLNKKVEGTQHYSNQVSTKYELFRFSQCEMNLREVNKSSGYKFIYSTTPNLKSLQKVEITQNRDGNWGIWLKFSNNFELIKESSGGYKTKEIEKKDVVVIFANDYENTKRIGSAFIRLLELCSEDSNEPF